MNYLPFKLSAVALSFFSAATLAADNPSTEHTPAEIIVESDPAIEKIIHPPQFFRFAARRAFGQHFSPVVEQRPGRRPEAVD